MWSYLILPLSLFGIMAIQAMGLQLILGGAGLLSFGHTAFFAIGGYASGAIVLFAMQSFEIQSPILLVFIGILFAMIITALAAMIIAIPCLRLRGDYLAVATMGFGQIVENVLNNIPYFGGASGFTNIPHLSNVGLIWAFVVFIGFSLGRFYKTGIGHAILCSRDDEVVARCFGISPEKSKLIAFIVGTMITGLAGALYVHTFQFISPVAAGFQKSIEILLAVVIGGMFSIWGALIGASILVLIPEFLRFLPQHLNDWIEHITLNATVSNHIMPIVNNFMQNSMLIFSIIVLFIIKKNPGGINSLLHFFKRPKHAAYS